jgi:putative ABC transport system permease protein
MNQASSLSWQSAAGDGGLPARRAILRWAWRLFRREWRQQVLVLGVITLAVATAVFTAASAYNLAPVPGNAEFGTVDHYLRFNAETPQGLAQDVAFAEAEYGTIDVIGRWFVSVPGSVEKIEVRAQDPDGPYGAPMLALLAGRYPTGGAEVALTDGVAATFGLVLHDPFELAGVTRTVVGTVENPSDLNAEFALVAPLSDQLPEEVVILVDSTDEKVIPFRAPSLATTIRSRRPSGEAVVAAAGVFGSAAVTMLLIALVATTSFIVIGQRRLRQLGLLAAVGATEKHLRLVTVANGLLLGLIAATIGVALGFVGWLAATPFIEPAVGFRLNPLNVPWWLIATNVLLAMTAATGAAWWPARKMARIPITLALAGRPPRPQPTTRSAALTGFLMVGGVVCLALANQTNQLLLIIGTLATALSILFAGPFILRAAAAAASPLPVAGRLALRDLARYGDRAGAALAAVSLALGIAAAIIISSAAAEFSADKGNLADNQLLIRTNTVVEAEGDNMGGPFLPARTPADLTNLDTQVAHIAALFDNPSLVALEAAYDPTMEPDPAFNGRPMVTLAEYTDLGGISGYRDLTLLYLATPAILEQYGLLLDELNPSIEVLTVETAEIRFVGTSRERGTQPELVTYDQQLAVTYSSLPGSFITPAALRQRGWQSAPVGWLVQANEPLTEPQLAAARQLAAAANLTIESRDHQEGLLALRSGATAVGILVALGVLAMTVGLIRSESAADLRTLTATGATSHIRRALTATTAGALALLGALLGTAGAYLALIAGYITDLPALAHVPIVNLLIIIAGIPLIAFAAGWLLAGPEPAELGRQRIE